MITLILGTITRYTYYVAYCLVQLLIVLMIAYNDWVHDPGAPLAIDYDYIVVGAGTAGTVIMSEMEPHLNVLIIESGPDTGLSLLEVPAISPALQRSKLDWSFLTAPQKNACNGMKRNQCRLAAGRGYGGSNILNNMIFYRGHEEDYRGWFTKPEHYNYENDVLPLFRELEQDLKVERMKHRSKLGDAFDQIKVSPDGTGHLKFLNPSVTQHNGWRWTTAHLSKSKLMPKRHFVLTNAHAIKLVFDENETGHAKYIVLRKNNKIFNLKARRGYIMAAGAIGTPKILLHSGVGPCNELARLNIPCSLDIEGVGKNLQDHIATGFDLVTLNTSLGYGLSNLMHPANAYNYLFDNGKSVLSTIGCESLGFHSESRDEPPKLGFMVLPMGMSVDAGAVLVENLNFRDDIWTNYFKQLIKDNTISIIPIVLRPKSRGYVAISSKDVDRPAIVDPLYLSHPDDIETLLEGINLIQTHLLNQPELKQLDAHITQLPLSRCAQFKFYSAEYWQCYIKFMSFSVYHLGGTCRIGDMSKNDTVVDRENFRLKGSDNVYIADASVMPNLPSGNINAAVALIAKQFMRELNNKMKSTEIGCDLKTSFNKESCSRKTEYEDETEIKDGSSSAFDRTSREL